MAVPPTTVSLSSSLSPIQRRSAESLSVERLRTAIVEGTLAPGARLTEVALAGQLGTSRATVRTALHALVAEGLAVQVPYTGWKVASLSPDDAWELLTLRASLEGLGAALAAERASDEARSVIAGAFDTLTSAARSGRVAAATAADFAFHRAIVDAAGHRRLAEHYRRVAQQVRVLIASSNALMSDPRALVAQHKPIFDAIWARKSDRAGTLVRRHIEVEGTKLLGHIKVAAPHGAKAVGRPVAKASARSRNRA